MCTWFSASWRRFRCDRKCLFSCIYNPQITISPTRLFSANLNRNRVKNHPTLWTCPLRWKRINLRVNFLFWTESVVQNGEVQKGVLYDSDIQCKESCCFIPRPLEQGPSSNIKPLQQTVSQNPIRYNVDHADVVWRSCTAFWLECHVDVVWHSCSMFWLLCHVDVVWHGCSTFWLLCHVDVVWQSCSTFRLLCHADVVWHSYFFHLSDCCVTLMLYGTVVQCSGYHLTLILYGTIIQRCAPSLVLDYEWKIHEDLYRSDTFL